MSDSTKTVIAVLEDLFFTVKIDDAAKRAGARTVFVKTADAAIQKITAEKPMLIVVDLNCSSIDPIELVTTIKSGEHRDVPVLGFVSHVQVDLRQRAQEAGYDIVIARSAFSGSLPDILRRHAALS
jgi:CheY-like chemotaxis protein